MDRNMAPVATKISLRWACFAVLLLQARLPQIRAFRPALSLSKIGKARTTSNTNSQLWLSKNPSGGGGGFGTNDNSKKKSKTTASSSLSSPAGDFAFQEMLVFFNSMQKQRVSSRTMDRAKRTELEGYVRTVLANRSNKSIPLPDIGQAILPQSQWKLMFSTSPAVLESLPQDATVFLNILDKENLDYILKFSKNTLGLDSLTAKSKYTFDAGPVQPGLLSYVYNKITTNVMGLSNIGVGFFGLLKGRVNYVESAYFDGTFWIERGVSPSGDSDFITVYMRVNDYW